MRRGPLSVVLIMLLAGGVGGCGHHAQPENKAPAQIADEKDEVLADAAAEDVDPAEDAAPKASDPLIRSLERVLESAPRMEGQDQARTIAREADGILARARQENREALRQVNRQQRVRGMDSPNVILIVADHLDCDALGCYGQANAKTPHIDRLAAEGARFTDCYAGSPRDQAAQWSLVTGLHTSRLQGDAPLVLRQGGGNLAEVFWRASYTTALVGDCSLAGTIGAGSARDLGFDEWFGQRTRQDALNAYPESVWNNGAQIKVLPNAGGKKGIHGIELLAKEALAYLDRRRGGRPFFLYLLLPLPESKPAETPASTPASVEPESPTPHADAIRRLDDAVGAIRQRLAQLRIGGSTIILLTSETGSQAIDAPASGSQGGSGQPGGKKGALGRQAIRVPLIVHGPGRVAGNKTVSELCGACDLLPTLAELVEAVRRPRQSDGVSLAPLLRGLPRASR